MVGSAAEFLYCSAVQPAVQCTIELIRIFTQGPPDAFVDICFCEIVIACELLGIPGLSTLA